MRKCSTKVEWNNNKLLTWRNLNANYDGKDSKVHGFFRRPGCLAPFFVDVWIFGGAQERHVRVEPNDACLGSQITDFGVCVFFNGCPLCQMEGEILKKRKSTLVTSGEKRWDEWLVSSTSESKVEYMSPWHHVDGLYKFTDICETVRKQPFKVWQYYRNPQVLSDPNWWFGWWWNPPNSFVGFSMQVFVVSFSIPVAGMYVYRAVKQVGWPRLEAFFDWWSWGFLGDPTQKKSMWEENAYIIGWLLRKWSLKKLKFTSWWSIWCTVDLKWVVVKEVKSLKSRDLVKVVAFRWSPGSVIIPKSMSLLAQLLLSPCN